MRFVYFDTETHLIKKGQMMPRLVCLSWAERVDLAQIDRAADPRVVTPEEVARGGWLGDGKALASFHVDSIGDVRTVLNDREVLPSEDGLARGLMLRDDALCWLYLHLKDDAVTLCGHNVVYDFGVAIGSAGEHAGELLRLVFQKYRKGLVRDTQTRAQLCDIATGSMKFHEDEDTGEPIKTSYHLADLAMRYLKRFLRKKDTWRTKYALLDGVPIEEWPEDAKRYAIDDAVNTLEVDEAIEELAGGPIPDAERQHRATWALHLMSAWGVRTDPAAVAKLKAELLIDYTEVTNKLRPSGLLNITPARTVTRGKRKGEHEPEEIKRSNKRIMARVSAAFESGAATGVRESAPMTEPSTKYPDGQISTAKKTLLATGDPDLKLVAERGTVAKLLDTYVPVLESGTEVPINPRYNALVETGRTSCARPNIQNPPRAGGVRDCFIPRDGWVYAFSDYDTLELRALSQVCLDMFGWSRMAEALRRGEDLHLSLAADMLGISYAEAETRSKAGDAEVKEYRQQSKPANFGFPGGMAAKSFKEYAEGYKIFLDIAAAEKLHDEWFKKWPEMDPYFDAIKNMTEIGDSIRQSRSGRVRGGASFCATANGFFQGLAADGAKAAVWAAAWECYVGTKWDPVADDEVSADGPPSPLYGTRPVFFLHDEIGIEIPLRWWGYERSATAAERLGEIMVRCMEQWIPDVPITAKPIMVRRWYKGADPVKVAAPGAGPTPILVPCRPVPGVDAKGKKITNWVADFDERMAA
jgi:DNA polymerase-1